MDSLPERIQQTLQWVRKILFLCGMALCFLCVEGWGVLRGQEDSKVEMARLLAQMPGIGHSHVLTLWAARTLIFASWSGREAPLRMRLLSRLLGVARKRKTRKVMRSYFRIHLHPKRAQAIVEQAAIKHLPDWTQKEIQELLQASEPVRQVAIRMAGSVSEDNRKEKRR